MWTNYWKFLTSCSFLYHDLPKTLKIHEYYKQKHLRRDAQTEWKIFLLCLWWLLPGTSILLRHLLPLELHQSWSEVNNIGLELTKGECWFAGWPTNFATILLISNWEKYINTIIQCVIYLKNKSLYQCIWFLAMNPFSILWY